MTFENMKQNRYKKEILLQVRPVAIESKHFGIGRESLRQDMINLLVIANELIKLFIVVCSFYQVVEIFIHVFHLRY